MVGLLQGKRGVGRVERGLDSGGDEAGGSLKEAVAELQGWKMSKKGQKWPNRVVVVVQLSEEGRSALQWALNKCECRDVVTVLHVVDALPCNGNLTPVNCVAEVELEVYKEEVARSCWELLCQFQDICEKKQVETSVLVSHGVDPKEVAVEEFSRLGATKVVIGDYGKRMSVKYVVDHLHHQSLLYCVKAGRLSCMKNGKVSKFLGTSDDESVKPPELSAYRSKSNLWKNAASKYKITRVVGQPADRPLPLASPLRVFDSPLSEPAHPPRIPPLETSYKLSAASPKANPKVDAGLPIPTRRNSSGDSSVNPSRCPSPSKAGLIPSSPFSRRKSVSKSGPVVTPLKIDSLPSSAAEGMPKTPSGNRTLSHSNSGNSIWAGTVLDSERTVREFVHRIANGGGSLSTNGARDVTTGWPFGMSSMARVSSWTGSLLDVSEDDVASANDGTSERVPELEGLWTQFYKLEMEVATGFFSESHLVGKGGCSKVYRGMLPDGRPVAIKRMFREGGGDSQQEWQTEVAMMTEVRHRHVVGLLGYCVDAKERILVYEYMERGNLEANLHDKSKEVLSWTVRLRAAMEVARAVEYLHDYCPKSIIHRDIKASNVLLSSNFTAKLADFGLAKWNPGSSISITAEVVGTFGYLAPEYFMYGKVNEKTDVYSYGVMLLELVTGRMPIDVTRPKGEENLVLWAKPLLESGKIGDLIDERLDGKYDQPQACQALHVASLCLRNNAVRRPSMNEVVRLLEEPLNEALLRDTAGLNGRPLRHLSMGQDEFFSKENSTQTWKKFAELALDGLEDTTDGRSSSSCSIERPAAEEYLEERMSPLGDETLRAESTSNEKFKIVDEETAVKSSKNLPIKTPTSGIWALMG